MALIKSAASASVSRLAVPLPMAIRLTWCLVHSARNACSAPSQSRRGSWGNTVAVSTSLPVASTTATFTPVRMPGSSPITTRGPAGAASSKSRTLSANTLMATFSASSRSRANKSRSRVRLSLTRQVQDTHLRKKSSAARPWCGTCKRSAKRASAMDGVPALGAASGNSGLTNFRSRTSSARPRKAASARCEGTRASGSS